MNYRTTAEGLRREEQMFKTGTKGIRGRGESREAVRRAGDGAHKPGEPVLGDYYAKGTRGLVTLCQ